MLIHAINESFHTCFVIFSFPLWLISFWASCWSCLILLASYTFSSSPQCSSFLFLHHFLHGQYPSIYFYVFLKKFTELFFYAKIYLLFICLSIYQDIDRCMDPCIFPFLSLIPCFFPSTLFPSLLPLYLLTSLPSFFPILT